MAFCSATLGICLSLARCQRGSGCNGGLVGPGPGGAPDSPRPSCPTWLVQGLSARPTLHGRLPDDSNELNSTDQLPSNDSPTALPIRRFNAAFYRVRGRSLFHLSPEARPRPLFTFDPLPQAGSTPFTSDWAVRFKAEVVLIHLCKSAAKLLIAHGRSDWLAFSRAKPVLIHLCKSAVPRLTAHGRWNVALPVAP